MEDRENQLSKRYRLYSHITGGASVRAHAQRITLALPHRGPRTPS